MRTLLNFLVLSTAAISAAVPRPSEYDAFVHQILKAAHAQPASYQVFSWNENTTRVFDLSYEDGTVSKYYGEDLDNVVYHLHADEDQAFISISAYPQVHNVNLPETSWMTTSEAKELVRSVEFILQKNELMVEFDEDSLDLVSQGSHTVIVEGHTYYNGVSVAETLGSFGTARHFIKIDLRSGLLSLYLREPFSVSPPRDAASVQWSAEQLHDRAISAASMLPRIDSFVEEDSGWIFTLKQGAFFDDDFIRRTGGSVHSNNVLRLNRLRANNERVLMYHVALRTKESHDPVYVYVDPQIGEVSKVVYLKASNLKINSQEPQTEAVSVKSSLDSGAWVLQGSKVKGYLIPVSLNRPGSCDARLVLKGEGRLIGVFDWHEEEGLLVFDGKAYRPDEALAEAIRNRPQVEPPAWLVEALKDKE